MTRALLFLLAFALASLGQNPEPQDEEDQLQQALSEAGPSPVEFIRAIENHLSRFPRTSRRPDLERAMVKAAMDALKELRLPEDIASLRGKSVEELRG